MSSKIISYGATTERSTDGGTTWASVAERTGVAVPAVQQEYPDATSLDSPGGFKEYLPGLKDAGEVTLPGWYTADGYEQALADQNSGVAIKYRTTLKVQAGQATGDVFEFDGYPTATLQDNGLGETMGLDLNIRITGQPTYTKGTAA